MSRHLRPLLLIAAICLTGPTARTQEEMVANPYYKFWAGSKPGATAVHVERTKLGGPEGKLLPEGVDEKRIAYKLVEANDKRAVVEQVVTERDFLGYIQAAPTRYIYPARLKKSSLERIIQMPEKAREETLKVGDREMKCKTVAGTIKGPDGEQIEFKVWLSDDVPGSIVKQVRTTRKKGELIAESTSTLVSFRKAKGDAAAKP
jgi:hypothetical protein